MSYRPKIGGSFVASSTKTTIDTKKCKHIFVINDGPNSVFLVIAQDTPADTNVAVTDFELKSGEHMGLDSEISDYGFIQMLAICNTAETATIRYLGWW